MPAQVKPISFRPGASRDDQPALDARSNPDEVDLGQWRLIKNYGVVNKNRLCRVPGFDKLLTRSDYNNQDLHDQLLSLSSLTRLPVTLLYQATSTRKATKLIAGTERVLFALNNGTGNWKIISDQLGATNARWKAASLGDVTIFTNNVDPVQHWFFDQGVTEASDQSIAPLSDLIQVGITKAGVVVEWSGHIFLMNVVVNGEVRSGSAYWCNYQNGTDWIPNDSSTAGNNDAMIGETVLGAIPLSNRLIVFTNRGIWEVLAVGGDQVFSFAKRYDPVESEGCLFYPNTLVSKGDELVYGGADGLYAYSLYQAKPQRVEWMHKASSLMYDFINRSRCEVHVAGYNSERKEILISYAKDEDVFPSETLVINTQYPVASQWDVGFSAIAFYVPKEPVQLVRDLLLRYCICTDDELGTYWDQFTKEGQFCTPQETQTCDQTPQSIWTQNIKTITYPDGDSVETEDYDQVTADSDSLCAILGESTTLQTLCESEERVDECNSSQRIVIASSVDYCIKELSENYYRERCTIFTSCGTYIREGYRSLLRSGPISLQNFNDDKEISRFELEASTVLQATPSNFRLRVGRHSQAVDPNADNCGIVWGDWEDREMKCLGEGTSASHRTNNTLPSLTFDWPLFYQAPYLYLEIEIINSGVTPTDTGGASCVSRMTASIRPIAKTW